MKNNNLKRKYYLFTLIFGFILAIFPLANDLIRWQQLNSGIADKIMIYNGLIFLLIGTIQFLVSKLITIKSNRIIGIVIITLSILSLFFAAWLSWNIISKTHEWSIISYEIESGKPPKNLIAHRFTAQQADSINLKFIADPILIRENNKYYLFFEAFKKANSMGAIGLATSMDAKDWKYDGLILEEAFHLSFPMVFKSDNQYFMIPESAKDSSIRLYKAVNFPKMWKFETKIITGQPFVDNVIFQHDNLWWLFTSTSNHNLLLYYSEKITGPWKSHPQNPIIENNPDGARMGGKIIFQNDSIIRVAQDDYPSYGNNISTLLIEKIDTLNYKEKSINFIPNFKGKEKISRNGIHSLNIINTNHSTIYIIDVY